MTSDQMTFDFGPDGADAARPVTTIPGLYYYPAFLDDEQQKDTVAHIDSEPWLSDLDRRVQQYGWRYDYRARTIDRDMRIGPLPSWLAEIAALLFRQTGLFNALPDQAIVNEYQPGQGIAMHIDRQCFGPTVATVSLGDDWTMDLSPLKGNGERERLLLEQGSALVLTGSARSRWMHGIAKRKSEIETYGRRARQRRISLTFRTVQVRLS